MEIISGKINLCVVQLHAVYKNTKQTDRQTGNNA